MNLNNYDQNISDENLLDECLQGRRWAWEIFYERFARLVSSAVKGTAARCQFKVTSEDLQDCEQCIWESFLEKDFDKLRRWERRASLATWVKICSCNAAINYFTSNQKRVDRRVTFKDPSPLTFLDNIQKTDLDRKLALQQLLGKIVYIIEEQLSGRERLFAAYFWFDELSFDEISEMMRISKQNLHLLRHRIIKKVKLFLRKELSTFESISLFLLLIYIFLL